MVGLLFGTTASLVWVLLLPSVHSLSANKVDRRSVVHGTGVALVSAVWNGRASPAVASATEPAALTVPRSKPVVVLGANGGTGQECVKALRDRLCIATSRSGKFVGDERAQLQTAAVDVTSYESLYQTLTSNNVGAVIFAASASTKGGNAFEVDRDGVVNAAKACIAAEIPRLVVVSSGTVTRPDSAVYKLLNTVGKGIMESKIEGEDKIREMYASPEVLQKKLGYTVIRPGGLTLGEGLGVAGLELNQGDNKSGRLARADVAALCVQCLDSPSAFDATFECYETLTAKPVESVGLSNILRLSDPTPFTSGKERHGTTWTELFDGLERDPGHSFI